jgi:rod shape-determining protein MreC
MQVRNLSLNKKNSTFLKVFSWAIVLFLFVAVLNIFQSQIKNYFYIVSNPLEKNFWAAGEAVSGFTNSILRSGSLAKENESLNLQNQKLLADITFLQEKETFFASQGEAALTYENSNFSLVMAGMMGLDGADLISIDKGSEDGVKEGMSVVNQQNVLFGKVFKVYKNFSQVMLISAENSIINVKIRAQGQEGEAASEIYGVLKGAGGLEAYLDLVPIDEEIKNGDVLITSALEGSFPKNLLVGTITEIIRNDQEPHQKAKVGLLLNIASSNLFVITNYKDKTN